MERKLDDFCFHTHVASFRSMAAVETELNSDDASRQRGQRGEEGGRKEGGEFRGKRQEKLPYAPILPAAAELAVRADTGECAGRTKI